MNSKRTVNLVSTVLLLILTITMITNTSFNYMASATGDQTTVYVLPNVKTVPLGATQTFTAWHRHSMSSDPDTVVNAVWSIEDGAGGSWSSSAAIYENTYTTENIGEWTVTAYSSGNSYPTGTATLRVVPPATKLSLSGPSSVVAGEFSTAFTLELKNADDETVTALSDVTIDLTASSGSWYSDLKSPTVITDVTIHAGESYCTLFYKGTTAGTIDLGASATDFIGASAELTVNPAEASQIVFSGPSSVTAGELTAYTLVLQDEYGNPVNAETGYDIVLSPAGKWYYTSSTTYPAGGINIDLGQSESNSVYYLETTAGSVTLSGVATPGGFTPSKNIEVVGANPLDNDHLTLTRTNGTTTVNAGDWLTFTAQATDTYGNSYDATDRITRWILTQYTIYDPPYVDNTVQLTRAGTWNVNAWINGVMSSNVVAITVNGGPASQLRFYSTDYTTPGESFTAEVTVVDEYGNIDTDYSGDTPTLECTDPTAVITVESSFEGTYTFTVTLNSLGVQTLTATADGLTTATDDMYVVQFTAANAESGANHGLAQGIYGDTIAVSGSGLKPDTDYRIGFSSAVVHTDSSGAFTGTFIIPEMRGGDGELDLIDDELGNSVCSIPFIVQTSIRISPTSGPAGTTAYLTVYNCPIRYPATDEYYSITATFNGNAIVLHDMENGDEYGTFTASIDIPSLPVGTYTFTVTGIYEEAGPSSIVPNMADPEDFQVSAQFQVTGYTVTVMQAAGGIISPGPQEYAKGATATYEIIPNTGYHIVDVVVDGVSKGAVTSWEFTNIAEAHTITAAFAVNSYTINFTMSGVGSDYTGVVLTVDGISYTASQLPLSFTWEYGSQHTYAYSSPLEVSGSKRYAVESITGLATAQSGTLTVPGEDGAVTAAFNTQYALTISTSRGSASGSGWYNAGSTAMASIASTTVQSGDSTRYIFIGWTGSATSTSTSVAITVDSAKSVTANWVTQYRVNIVANPDGAQNTLTSSTWMTAGSLPISATAKSGYTFNSWTSTGSITIADASATSTTATISGSGTITANFNSNSPTDIVATVTTSGETYSVSLGGNITASQMSNMTITPNQSTETTIIELTVTGETGTEGFSNITISKNAIPYGTTPQVYIDGKLAENQGYTEDDNNYYIWYTTHFSTHNIKIEFVSSTGTSDNAIYLWVIGVTVLAILAVTVGFLRYKKRQ